MHCASNKKGTKVVEIYSSLSESVEIHPWFPVMPKSIASTKPYEYCVMSYTFLPMIKFNLEISQSKILAITDSEIKYLLPYNLIRIVRTWSTHLLFTDHDWPQIMEITNNETVIGRLMIMTSSTGLSQWPVLRDILCVDTWSSPKLYLLMAKRR